jgi:hypothetical protein
MSLLLYSYQYAIRNKLLRITFNYVEIVAKKYEMIVLNMLMLISYCCHLLCWFRKYQYLANHVRRMYVTPVRYCSRFVSGKRYCVDMSPVKWKSANAVNSYLMMRTLYT